MKKTCWLLLSFCAIATTIFITKDPDREKTPAVLRVPRYFPCDNACLLPTRMTPLLSEANPLDLSPEQMDAISSLIENQHSVLLPLLGKIVTARKKIHQKTRAALYDESSMRSITDEMSSLLAEALMERERLDAKIYSVFTKEQREHAEELVQSVETILSEENNSPYLAAIVTDRMNSILPLSNAQAAEVESSIEKARQEISPPFKENQSTLSNFRFFNDAEARSRTRRQAKEMTAIMLASEKVAAKAYGFVRESRKNREDDFDVIESCIRVRILNLRDKGPSSRSLSDQGVNLLQIRQNGPHSAAFLDDGTTIALQNRRNLPSPSRLFASLS